MQTLAGQQLGRGYIRELDGLRGIAILLVLLHHFWPAQGPLQRFAHVAHLGWIGVDLFFVISGFLIAGILLDTRADPGYYRNFYARRCLRIFPLYYLFVVGLFVVIPAFQDGPYGQTTFLRQSGSPAWYLLYLGNVRESITGKEPAYFLAPLWSLSIEEQFYLAFPLLVARLEPPRLRRLLIALIAAAPIYRAITVLLIPHNERIQYLSTPSRMDELALGGLLALLVRTRPVLPRPGHAAAVFFCGAAALCAAFLLGGLDRTRIFCRVIGYSMIGATCAALVLWAVLSRGREEARLLRAGWLCSLGKICYGVYLLQRPVEIALLKISGKLGLALDPTSGVTVLAKCAAAIGVAAISWHLFEKQLLRLKGLFASRNHPALRPG
jgi:peptidoglycan/LPS O-acetylase OafA/YrhL